MLWKFLTPILIFIGILVLLACCIVPCVKAMVTSLIKSTIRKYVQLSDSHLELNSPFQDDEFV